MPASEPFCSRTRSPWSRGAPRAPRAPGDAIIIHQRCRRLVRLREGGGVPSAVFALLVVLGILATVRPGESTNCAKVDDVRVQLRWLRNGQFAGYYAAEALGYYSQECLNVTLLQRQNAQLPEDQVINGNVDFATSWSTSDIKYREANQTSYVTIAQIFRRPGLGALASHLTIPNNITTLEDVKVQAEAMGRQIRMAVTDDVYALWARLADLNISTCGAYKSVQGGDPSCSEDDDAELIARDLHGLRNIKVDETHGAFADFSVTHVTDLSSILRAVASDGNIVGTIDRAKLVEPGGASILEDGVAVSEAWLREPGNTDLARRFLKATLKGWILCRDSPRTCAESAYPEGGQAQMEFLFQTMEVNKLIWPSPRGAGKVVLEEFQEMYNYMAGTGLASTVYNASNSLVTDIVDGVMQELSWEGHDIYGHFYASEPYQQTLDFCLDSNNQPVLCAMRCATGSEPPPGGQIFLEDDCLVCQAGTASPGGTEPCLPCAGGQEAPSPGMALCVAGFSSTVAFVTDLGCAGMLIGLLAIAGLVFWRRSVHFSKQLEDLHSDAGLDTDSPLVQTLRFLDDIAQGSHYYGLISRPFRYTQMKERAQQLRLKLVRSKDVNVPDIEDAMQNKEYSEDIVKFVMQSSLKTSGSKKFVCSSFSLRRQLSNMDIPSGISTDLKRLESFGRLGEEFQLDVLSWVQAQPTGLLAEVLLSFVSDWGLVDSLGLSISRLRGFASVIELGHVSNPYHCLAHSIDVTVRLGTMLNKSGLSSFLANEKRTEGRVVLLGAILSAVVHDYKHVGYANRLLVEDENEIAIRFNDQSCLENLALVEALDVMRSEEFAFARSMPTNSQKQLRKVIIRMVLATDMGKHFIIQTAFQAKVLDQKTRSVTSFAALQNDQLFILLEVMLKCADLGHCAMPWETHLKWLNRLQEELFSQGDVEKEKCLPVSPLADRSKPGAMWGSNQVGFLEALVLPLFKVMVLAAPGCQELLDGVSENVEKWQRYPKLPPDEMLQKLSSDAETWDSRGLSAVSASIKKLDENTVNMLFAPESAGASETISIACPMPQPRDEDDEQTNLIHATK